MTDAILTHDLDGDPYTCSMCGDDLEPNAHTLYDWLAHGPVAVLGPYDRLMAGTRPGWTEYVREHAAVSVAELDDGNAYCWCGHSLHYPDCACDAGPDGLTCAKRYALEAFTQPDPHLAPEAWHCPSEDAEHWPKHIEQAGDGQLLITCGYCAAESVFDQTTGTTDEPA